LDVVILVLGKEYDVDDWTIRSFILAMVHGNTKADKH
jgi:hypothetical protein